jgi:hypothetical protein
MNTFSYIVYILCMNYARCGVFSVRKRLSVHGCRMQHFFFGESRETCSIGHGKPFCCRPEFSETTDTNLTKVDGNKKVPSDYVQNQKRSESCAAVSSASVFSHAEVCLLSLGTRCDLTNPRRLGGIFFIPFLH